MVPAIFRRPRLGTWQQPGLVARAVLIMASKLNFEQNASPRNEFYLLHVTILLCKTIKKVVMICAVYNSF